MTTTTTAIETPSGSYKAYLAVPDKPNGGGVVVLQEIFGVNSAMRAAADWLAGCGYYAIVPDLFWRQQAGVQLDPGSETDRAIAMSLMQAMDQGAAVADALVAAEYLRGLPQANGKVGAIGYCLGGKLAYLIASKPGIDAATSYYGVAIQADLSKFEELQCPLLLHIAAQDELCPAEAQQAITDAAEASSLAEVMRHPDVGHAFARRNSSAYRAEAAERADAATIDFFARKIANP